MKSVTAANTIPYVRHGAFFPTNLGLKLEFRALAMR